MNSDTTTAGWSLVCPACRSALMASESCYVCGHCGSLYPVRDGVIHFTSTDTFYEGRYSTVGLSHIPNEDTFLGKFWLYQYVMHYLWYIRRYVPKNSKLLDIAGGGGIAYFARWWNAAGLEVSSPHAQAMARWYQLAVCADALHIPLEDSSVDAVVSRFFLEHLSPDIKRDLITECRRVLRPGGWLITLQDCESNNPLWLWAKLDQRLFQQNFIERDGHHGLIYASENLKLFEEGGLHVVNYHATNKTSLVSLSMLEWMQAYRSKSPLANTLLRSARFIYRNRWLSHAYNVGMTMFDDVIEQALPLDHARYLLAVCQKPE